jgi:thiamine pyrophosphate-dependent acetolactate synthase large subunit-like protein
MRRSDALAAVRETIGEDLVIASLGGNGRDWLALRERNSFCVHHAMGLPISVALGVAVARPDDTVWAIEADGGLLMNLGFLGVVGKLQPPNLRVLVFDNETYLSGGGLPTLTHDAVDLAAVASACGWRHSRTVRDVGAFAAAVTDAAARREPSFVLAKVDTSVAGPPSSAEYVETKLRFVRDVERKLGIEILRPAERVQRPHR